MKNLIIAIASELFCYLSFAQEQVTIKYPFSMINKTIINQRISSTGLGLKEFVAVSSDGKYGLWFIENQNVHFYDCLKNEWKLFNRDNGLFDGNVGVIYHDSNSKTWLGSQRDQIIFDGYAVMKSLEGGVCFYDGNDLKLFQKSEIGTKSPEIINIFEGPSDEIFISTGCPESKSYDSFFPGGLYMYKDNQWFDFTRGVNKCPIKYVLSFNVDSTKTLWLQNRLTNINYCTYQNGKFFFPSQKFAGAEFFLTFSEKNIWLVTFKGIFQYNYCLKEFVKLGDYEKFILKQPIVLSNDMVCYFVGSFSLLSGSISSENKLEKKLDELKIVLVDHGNIFRSDEQNITKDLYFKTAAIINENHVLFGTNKGIINFNNGEFQILKEFDLILNKDVRKIFVSKNNKAFIICEEGDLYFFDKVLSKIELPKNQGSVKYYCETLKGDMLFSTGETVFLIRSASTNIIEKLAGDLNECKYIFEINKKLYLICQDGIKIINT
jgi:ligand-binding sensor domain-containing protein